MQTYRDLTVWQHSIELVKEIYHLTNTFPKSEIYGLASQMRRAAVSISANLAEGYVRKHRPEYLQFVRVAFGSGAELETLLTIGVEIGMIDKDKINPGANILNGVMRMLNKLISSLSAP